MALAQEAKESHAQGTRSPARPCHCQPPLRSRLPPQGAVPALLDLHLRRRRASLSQAVEDHGGALAIATVQEVRDDLATASTRAPPLFVARGHVAPGATER